MFFLGEFFCTNLKKNLVAYSLCNFGEKNVYMVTYEMKNVKKKKTKWIKWMLQRMTSRKFGNEKGQTQERKPMDERCKQMMRSLVVRKVKPRKGRQWMKDPSK